MPDEIFIPVEKFQIDQGASKSLRLSYKLRLAVEPVIKLLGSTVARKQGAYEFANIICRLFFFILLVHNDSN